MTDDAFDTADIDALESPERVWELSCDAARWSPDAPDNLGDISEGSLDWFIGHEESQAPHEIERAETERPCKPGTWELAGALNEETPASKSRDALVRRVEVQLIMANARSNWQKIENRLR